MKKILLITLAFFFVVGCNKNVLQEINGECSVVTFTLEDGEKTFTGYYQLNINSFLKEVEIKFPKRNDNETIYPITYSPLTYSAIIQIEDNKYLIITEHIYSDYNKYDYYSGFVFKDGELMKDEIVWLFKSKK